MEIKTAEEIRKQITGLEKSVKELKKAKPGKQPDGAVWSKSDIDGIISANQGSIAALKWVLKEL